MGKHSTDVSVRKFSRKLCGDGITAETEADTVTQEQTVGNEWEFK